MPSVDQPHVWRSGQRTTISLVDHLRAVTESAANTALELYSSDDDSELLWAAVCSGLALECVLKLSIATTNPVLLADNRAGPRSAVMMARHESVGFTASDLKTIAGMQAWATFNLIQGEPRKGTVTGKTCEQVFEVRNSAVHMGIADPAEVREAIKNMVSVIHFVMDLLENDPAILWREENVQLAESLVDEKASDDAIRPR